MLKAELMVWKIKWPNSPTKEPYEELEIKSESNKTNGEQIQGIYWNNWYSGKQQQHQNH